MPGQAVVRRLDAAALRRVFDNILGNAAKYSDGDLAVQLLPDGSVTFSNNARVLSRVQAERLFIELHGAREVGNVVIFVDHSEIHVCTSDYVFLTCA